MLAFVGREIDTSLKRDHSSKGSQFRLWAQHRHPRNLGLDSLAVERTRNAHTYRLPPSLAEQFELVTAENRNLIDAGDLVVEEVRDPPLLVYARECEREVIQI